MAAPAGFLRHLRADPIVDAKITTQAEGLNASINCGGNEQADKEEWVGPSVLAMRQQPKQQLPNGNIRPRSESIDGHDPPLTTLAFHAG